jgi:hypothetical protein
VGEEPCILNFWGKPLGNLPFGMPENNSKRGLTGWCGTFLLQLIALISLRNIYVYNVD